MIPPLILIINNSYYFLHRRHSQKDLYQAILLQGYKILALPYILYFHHPLAIDNDILQIVVDIDNFSDRNSSAITDISASGTALALEKFKIIDIKIRNQIGNDFFRYLPYLFSYAL